LPTVYALTSPKQQWEDANGNPLSGYKLFLYLAGTSTKATTYQNADGTITNSNPIVLNTLGLPASGVTPVPIYVATGTYKMVMAPPTDSDPPSSPLWTEDNIRAINDSTALTIDQWIVGPTPTYISATQFSLAGDVTSAFQVGRRIKAAVTAGTVYGRISVSAFGAVTTVTVVLDSGTLDSGLSSISYGLLSPLNNSVPWLTGLESVLPDTVAIRTGSADSTKRWIAEIDGIPAGLSRTSYPVSIPLRSIVSADTLIESDYGKIIFLSGTFTLAITAAATLGSGWYCDVMNSGTGTITIDPNGSETILISGGPQTAPTTITLPYSGSVEGPYNVSGGRLWCSGSVFVFISTIEAHGTQRFTSSGSWTAPAGVTSIWLSGAAGGGGGGQCAAGGHGAGGGGGGECAVDERYAVVPGAAYTVTVGAGGAGATGGAGDGTAGGNGVFGSGPLRTLVGGGGGISSLAAASTIGGAAGGAGGMDGEGGLTTGKVGGSGGGTQWAPPTFNISRVDGTAYHGRVGTVYGGAGSGAGPGPGNARNGGNGAAGFWAVRW